MERFNSVIQYDPDTDCLEIIWADGQTVKHNNGDGFITLYLEDNVQSILRPMAKGLRLANVSKIILGNPSSKFTKEGRAENQKRMKELFRA